MAPACTPRSTLLGNAAASVALLFVTELLLIVSVPPSRKSAPESAKRPLGADALARLPLITLLLIVSTPIALWIPAPSASLATSESPAAVPTRLLLTAEFVSVNVPQLSMPPPTAPANGHGPVGQIGQNGSCSGLGPTVSVGATRFPVMTLFAIVTVAPPVKSAFGGISTPPPAAKTPS